MARLEWVHQRLERWAEWVARGKACSRGMLPMFRGQPSEVVRPLQGVTLDEAECWRTEKAIMALPAWLPETVMTYYLSGSAAAQERQGITRFALAQRMTRAHKLLADAFLAELDPNRDVSKGVLNH
jgi:hypothetical protein